MPGSEQLLPDMITVLRQAFPASRSERNFFGTEHPFFVDTFRFSMKGIVDIALRSIPYNIIVRNKSEYNAAEDIRTRLHVTEAEFDQSIRFGSTSLQMDIEGRRPNDTEVMFLLALKHATVEHPVEVYLQQLRAAAELGYEALQGLIEPL